MVGVGTGGSFITLDTIYYLLKRLGVYGRDTRTSFLLDRIGLARRIHTSESTLRRGYHVIDSSEKEVAELIGTHNVIRDEAEKLIRKLIKTNKKAREAILGDSARSPDDFKGQLNELVDINCSLMTMTADGGREYLDQGGGHIAPLLYSEIRENLERTTLKEIREALALDMEMALETGPSKTDYLFVTLTAGGATGAGFGPLLVENLKKWFHDLKVICIVVLPAPGEEYQHPYNVIFSLGHMYRLYRERFVEMILLVDNEQLANLAFRSFTYIPGIDELVRKLNLHYDPQRREGYIRKNFLIAELLETLMYIYYYSPMDFRDLVNKVREHTRTGLIVSFCYDTRLAWPSPEVMPFSSLPELLRYVVERTLSRCLVPRTEMKACGWLSAYFRMPGRYHSDRWDPHFNRELESMLRDGDPLFNKAPEGFLKRVDILHYGPPAGLILCGDPLLKGLEKLENVDIVDKLAAFVQGDDNLKHICKNAMKYFRELVRQLEKSAMG